MFAGHAHKDAAAQGSPEAPEAVGRSEPLKREESPEVSYPADRIYDVSEFMKFRNCQKPVPENILRHARVLWKRMPENITSLAETNSLRSNLFKDDVTATHMRVLPDRKLHNEVLGILGKVTEKNMEVMQKELTDLPIRQSTEAEIRDVINVFFGKCTRPEDTRYTPLYVQLISHLISTIGDQEAAGRMIRKEVMNQCRDTFINAANKSKQLEERIAKLSEEEADLERMQFAAKLKANIYFLGLMFRSRLTSETVVRAVLDNLLYGDGRRRRIVPDYCIILFMELLQTCGPHMDRSFYIDPLPRYVAVLEDFSRTYPKKRIQFLLLNFLETINNNWVPLHGPDAHRDTSSVASPSSPMSNNLPNGSPTANAMAPLAKPVAPIPPPSVLIEQQKNRIPDRGEFWRVMDDFFSTSDVEEIISVIGLIPHDVLVVYCSKWLGRYITTYRYTQERSRLGELFEQLVNRNAIPPGLPREALLDHVKQAINEDLFIDQPKYFFHWAAVIKNGKSVFPLSLHTTLLDMLVDHHMGKEVIVKMVLDVQKAIEESSGKPTEQKDYQAQDRFRVLQALLRYSPPLLSRDEASMDDEDILTSVAEKDTETAFFQLLGESYEESKSSTALFGTADMLRTSLLPAYPFISALFTFVRFDIDHLCTYFKDVIRKIFGTRTIVSLFEEVYVQWVHLECSEVYYFSFVKKVYTLLNCNKSELDKLRDRLRNEYHAEKFVAQMDKYLK
ncbi:unnamed protein product [Phytomonas sp. EM1]|nr:unnamed protein product [Phytomonas sp. EM1]|eukprot:CCW63564.1 unnamed protein product [Phytomonas sp. isolate EM1]